jgi:hypothetical protein
MSRLSPSARRSRILAVVLLAATGGVASVGRTQQVPGSIGASLSILEPAAAAPPRVTGFDVGRDGIARIETILSPSPRASRLVMARISSSATRFTPELQPPTLVTPSSAATRASYRVRVPRDRPTDRTRPTELRVEYLIVPGT